MNTDQLLTRLVEAQEETNRLLGRIATSQERTEAVVKAASVPVLALVAKAAASPRVRKVIGS